MNKLDNNKKKLSTKQTEILVAAGFTLLVLVLSWSKIVYVPISSTRMLDISIVPLLFAAMIGGYKVAIPIGIGWSLLNYGSYHNIHDIHWIFLIRITFALSTVFFYDLFKKRYKRSPWNVYRTIFASLLIKNAIDAISMLIAFPSTSPSLWMKDSLVVFTIELAICVLAMSLLIEKLREIHVLNGVRRKEKVQNESTVVTYNQQN